MTGSGLNMNELHLNNKAAQRVALEFQQMAPQLEEVRNQALSLATDLGMGACREGETWNSALNDVVKGADGSIVAAIDGIIAEAKALAEWAETAQTEYDATEHRNAESYAPLDPSGSYPPISGD
jgi:hypothetical protein